MTKAEITTQKILIEMGGNLVVEVFYHKSTVIFQYTESLVILLGVNFIGKRRLKQIYHIYLNKLFCRVILWLA